MDQCRMTELSRMMSNRWSLGTQYLSQAGRWSAKNVPNPGWVKGVVLTIIELLTVMNYDGWKEDLATYNGWQWVQPQSTNQ